MDQGAARLRSSSGDSFELVAQALALLAEAVGGGTPFHDALGRRLEEAVDRAATLPKSAPTFGVRAPYILDMAQLEALAPWLEEATQNARASCQQAFLDTLAAIHRPPGAFAEASPEGAPGACPS